MENLSEDQEIVDLLAKLKQSNGGYPSDMLAARRQTYLKQMANAGLGIGIGAGLKDSLKGGGNGAAATTTAASKVLEVALIAAIALEAGTAAFLYRDQIGSAIRSYVSGPRAQEVTSPPDKSTSSNDSTLVETIGTSLVTASETPSATPSSTPPTPVAGATHQNTNGQNNHGGTNSSINANATPTPGGNQGNQYGLTPKPERTVENNGGGGGNDTGSNDNDTGGNGGGGNNGGGGGNSNRP